MAEFDIIDVVDICRAFLTLLLTLPVVAVKEVEVDPLEIRASEGDTILAVVCPVLPAFIVVGGDACVLPTLYDVVGVVFSGYKLVSTQYFPNCERSNISL